MEPCHGVDENPKFHAASTPEATTMKMAASASSSLEEALLPEDEAHQPEVHPPSID